ncbi:MAG: ComEC/Rec2 family competence protein [Prevotella sp.]|nr:ComEC/Rec2 family competence protein [Prevotella sp.]
MRSTFQLYPLLNVALALVVGMVFDKQTGSGVPTWVWLSLLSLSVVSSLCFYRKLVVQSVLILVAVVMLGGTLMSMKQASLEVEPPWGKKDYTAVVASSPKLNGKALKCDLLVMINGKPMKTMATIERDYDADNLKPGDGILFTSYLNVPANGKKATFDYRSYLLNNGYLATTYIHTDDWCRQAAVMGKLPFITRLKLSALQFRERLLQKYKELGFDDEEYEVLAAMTLGQKSAMSAELKEDYAIAGAGHVLALSGLHLSTIYVFLTLLISVRRRLWYIISQVIIISAIWAYVFIVGMSISVTRAAIMLTVYSLVSMLNRDRISLNTISLAAIIILACNPLTAYDVGCQMSFLAVLSITLFYRPIFYLMPFKWRGILPVKWVWGMFSVSTAAKIGVLPLIAFYFHRISCYSPITDLVIIPLVTVILYGTVLLLLTGFFPLLQAIIGAILIYIVYLLNSFVSSVARLPGVSIENINISLTQLIIAYGVLVLLILLCRYMYKQYVQYKSRRILRIASEN